MDNFSVDAYTPEEIAATNRKGQGSAKVLMTLSVFLALAILAGAFIALGAVFFTCGDL